MAAPVTGPFVRSWSEPFADNRQVRWRQARPYNLTLPYSFTRSEGSNSYYSGGNSGTVKQATFSASGLFSVRLDASAYNQAYERLKGKVSDTAGWGENIAQAKSSRTMINDRLTQIARFTLALRKGRFGEAAAALSVPRPSGASARKKISQNFLEYEYGWAPLVSDIRSSIEILTSDVPMRKFTGRAFENAGYSNRTSGPGSRSTEITFATQKVQCFSGVYIRNPNLFLAARLGFLDPALPWKLLPFSFVVDWLINVEQVISSCSDWFGCQLVQPGYTRVYRGNRTYVTATWHPGTGEVYSTSNVRQSSIEMVRYQGLPSPTLILKPFKGLSLNRGLQAIALILSCLGK